jgi:hypothetical protein
MFVGLGVDQFLVRKRHDAGGALLEESLASLDKLMDQTPRRIEATRGYLLRTGEPDGHGRGDRYGSGARKRQQLDNPSERSADGEPASDFILAETPQNAPRAGEKKAGGRTEMKHRFHPLRRAHESDQNGAMDRLWTRLFVVSVDFNR